MADQLEQITVRYTLSRTEFGACFRRVQARRWRHWTTVAVGGAVAVIGAVSAHVALLAGGLVYAIGYAAVVWLVLPGVTWRRVPQLRSGQAVSVCDAGVLTQSSNATTTADWSFWRRASLIAGIYVLEARLRGRCLVPRRAFNSPEDEQRFRELLRRHLPAAALKRL